MASAERKPFWLYVLHTRLLSGPVSDAWTTIRLLRDIQFMPGLVLV